MTFAKEILVCVCVYVCVCVGGWVRGGGGGGGGGWSVLTTYSFFLISTGHYFYLEYEFIKLNSYLQRN